MKKLPFGVDRPEDSPGFLLWQTTMLWQRQIKKTLEKYEISHAQFVIMASILWFEAHKIKTAQVSIINWTKLDKMTVSKALKELSHKNLVLRKEDESDTRAKMVFLTLEGKNLVSLLIPIVEGIDSKFFGVLEDFEQKEIIKFLDKITKENL